VNILFYSLHIYSQFDAREVSFICFLKNYISNIQRSFDSDITDPCLPPSFNIVYCSVLLQIFITFYFLRGKELHMYLCTHVYTHLKASSQRSHFCTYLCRHCYFLKLGGMLLDMLLYCSTHTHTHTHTHM
jgi:hypothetical protein